MRARTTAQSASACLRQRTREEHEAIEAALDMEHFRTRAGLVAVLRCWVAVWNQLRLAVVEPGASGTAAAELLVPSGQALDWLAADLAFLAPPADAVAAYRTVPADAHTLQRFIADPSASWGLAYVLRGSRVGGGVLAPLTREALDLPDDRGTHFLASRGTDPGREWVSFRRRLDAVELTAAELTAAVDAARWTFGWVGTAAAPDARMAPVHGQASR